MLYSELSYFDGYYFDHIARFYELKLILDRLGRRHRFLR